MCTPGERGAGSGLPEEVWAEVLDSDRRRALLAHLAASEEPVALTDLAAEIARAEDDVPSTERVRRIRTDLFQTHLPKLNATGIVRYDSKLGTVDLVAPLPEGDEFGGVEAVEK